MMAIGDSYDIPLTEVVSPGFCSDVSHCCAKS